ncbi:MAG: hypothetical protein EKK29_05925 [Hyphomicrobiales bacterium]|nr:MAG: hypothetical protein EKK29_05925 [Hyphomicrobiales bacterium]
MNPKTRKTRRVRTAGLRKLLTKDNTVNTTSRLARKDFCADDDEIARAKYWCAYHEELNRLYASLAAEEQDASRKAELDVSVAQCRRNVQHCRIRVARAHGQLSLRRRLAAFVAAVRIALTPRPMVRAPRRSRSHRPAMANASDSDGSSPPPHAAARFTRRFTTSADYLIASAKEVCHA